ncbi:MAG: 1-acyl-sn-glycerol-3-phosphate acyltransferase [Acidobacteriota bacterium]|nr:MAG: 1-acyl-sn-glycerol-3-phosphate acyltransferase [Acidobacteriota bacterium]
MRRIARLIGFVVVCLIFMALAITALGILSFGSERRRKAFILWGTRAWARTLLRVMAVRVHVTGLRPEHLRQPHLLVSNHLSYLDIIVIDSAFPAAFVAKTEVGGWPLLGPLARMGKAVFIVREDARSNVTGFYEACGRLREGYSVAVFPESTTGDGAAILPFKPLFLAMATRTGVDILPATINFRSVNGSKFGLDNRDLLCWYGDMEFTPHFWNFLTAQRLEVSIMFHDPIEAPRGTRTRELSRAVQIVVEDGYEGFPEARVPIAYPESGEKVYYVEKKR